MRHPSGRVLLECFSKRSDVEVWHDTTARSTRSYLKFATKHAERGPPDTRRDVCNLTLPCTPCYAGHLPTLDNEANKHQTSLFTVGQKIKRSTGNVEALRESTRFQIVILKLE